MRYSIIFESDSRIRFRILGVRIKETEEPILKFALSQIPGVRKVDIYRATGGCALTYKGAREDVITRLDAFNYQNVMLFGEQPLPPIGMEEVENRSLSPELKRKMRTKMLIEAAADLLLPTPLQLGYHVYQIVTLKNI